MARFTFIAKREYRIDKVATIMQYSLPALA